MPHILVKEPNSDGYYLAKWIETRENADEEFIEVYECKEYYHDLESALRNA